MRKPVVDLDMKGGMHLVEFAVDDADGDDLPQLAMLTEVYIVVGTPNPRL